MGCRILDGKKTAAKVREEAALRARALTEKGCTPCLAVVLAGDDPASAVYVRNKETACRKAGIQTRVVRLPQDTDTAKVIGEVTALSLDPLVHAVLVQLPLPGQVDEKAVLDSIPPEKDADGFTTANMGKLLKGERGPRACTPMGCMRLLKEYGIDPRGMNAVVIGRSLIVGKPMALMLAEANATVTVCHRSTRDVAEYTRGADLVVCAVGKSGFLRPDMVRQGAVLIDVGINRQADGTLTGDIDPACGEKASYMTPVPGGVGPMTVAMLLINTVSLAEAQHG